MKIYRVLIAIITCFLIACEEESPSTTLLEVASETSMDAGEQTEGGEETGGDSANQGVAGSEQEVDMGRPTEAGTDTIEMDSDQDGIPDTDDNCPMHFNPTQSDIDGDGIGDACAVDSDGDGVPDQWDPEPDDADWPGRTHPDTVYAQTATALYALDVKSLRLNLVADFSFDTDGNHQVTDIAIDRAGVLWAITFNTLWVCHPQRGECRAQARLPFTNFNGLTFLPGSLFEEPRDVLVGIDIPGSWRRLDLFRGEIVDELLGSYPDETSSGDAFSIEEVGSYAAVKRSGAAGDVIIKITGTNPREIADVVVLDGYQKIYGLAGWRGSLFAFDETGVVIMIKLDTLEIRALSVQQERWWGAAVSSILRTEIPTQTESSP